MFDIQNYFKSTIDLVNSLTIKIDELSKHFNYQYFIKNSLELPLPSEDKYFLNICGIRSKLDPKVFVRDSNLNIDIELTISNLENNLWLKKELTKFDTLFNTVCKNYPGMSTYIRGCINPLNFQDLLNTPNFTILYYNKNLISENELYLISEMEDFIAVYMSTYHNPAYMLDELYIPTLVFNLYQSLVMFILTKRLENVLTHKTDLFHIDNFLSSYKHVYNEMDVFNKQTEIYLYGNIRRIKTSVGRNEILEELLYKVYDANNYGVGELKFNRERPVILDVAVNDYKKEFFDTGYNFEVMKTNDSLYNIEGDEYDLRRVMSLEDECGLVNDDKLFLSEFNVPEKYDSFFLKTKLNTSKTKAFLLDKPNKISTHHNNIVISTFSNLIMFLNKTETFFYIDYINPDDHKVYKLSSLDLKNILIYNITRQYKILEGSVTLELEGLVNTIPNKDMILASTWHKRSNNDIYDYITEGHDVLLRVGEIVEYFKYANDLERRIWYMMSNVNDLMIKNDIRVMSKFLITSDKLTVNVTDTYNYLLESGLSVFTKNDPLLNNIMLMEYVTKLDLRPDKTILDRFKKLVTFFDKTSSYTIQLIYDSEFKDTFVNNVTKNNLNLGYKPLMEVKDAEWYKYEQVNYLIKSFKMEPDNLSVRRTQVNETYLLTKVGRLSCFSIYDSISRNTLLIGNRLIRPRKMATREPKVNLYEDNKILNTHDIKTMIPSTHKVMPMEVFNLSKDKIGGYNNEFNLYATFDSYMVNYSTRYKSNSFVLDNGDLTINHKDLDYGISTIQGSSVVINGNEIVTPTLTYTTNVYSRFMSTSRILATNVINDGLSVVTPYTNIIDSKILKEFTVHNITEEFNSKVILHTVDIAYMTYLTRIIEDISSEVISDRSTFTTKHIGSLYYNVISVSESTTYVNSDDINTLQPSYDAKSFNRFITTDAIVTNNTVNDDVKITNKDYIAYNNLVNIIKPSSRLVDIDENLITSNRLNTEGALETTTLIDSVTTELVKDTSKVNINNTDTEYTIKPNATYNAYIEIEDLNNLNFSYSIDSYSRNITTDTTIADGATGDEKMEVSLEVSAESRNYNSTVVETDSEGIEVDLTFEILKR